MAIRNSFPTPYRMPISNSPGLRMQGTERDPGDGDLRYVCACRTLAANRVSGRSPLEMRDSKCRSRSDGISLSNENRSCDPRKALITAAISVFPERAHSIQRFDLHTKRWIEVYHRQDSVDRERSAEFSELNWTVRYSLVASRPHSAANINGSRWMR
jgi:hypothetical protein